MSPPSWISCSANLNRRFSRMTRFKTIHWGLSGWTILVLAIALGLLIHTVVLLGLLRQAQEHNDQLAYRVEELRLVPYAARLCKSYWRLSDTTGVTGRSEEELCRALLSTDQSIVEPFTAYVEERRDQ